MYYKKYDSQVNSSLNPQIHLETQWKYLENDYLIKMEYPQHLIFDGIKYSILGDHTVQVVLLAQESIITQKRYIQYHSNIDLETHSPEQLINVINNSKDEAAYVGLSAQQGKVMVLDMAIFNNYVVKYSSILATTNILEIASNRNHQAYRKISFNSSKLMKQQLVFLITRGTVIEKDLGEGEIIFVKKNSLLVIQEHLVTDTNDPLFCKITGPGRILFEIENSAERLDIQKYVGIFAFHSIWLCFIFIILLI